MKRELVESFNDYESKVKDFKTAVNESWETEAMMEVENLKLQL